MKSRQMYKIYVNQTKVILLQTDDLPKEVSVGPEVIIATYTGKVKHIFNYLDMFEKSGRIKECYLHFSDFGKLKKDFKSIFKIVPAAGGLVMNENNEILFIHRRGSWDLPKGKLDPNETKKEAAIREVEEETGVNGLSIEKKLLVTKHTYKDKNKRRCIKKSYWYLMKCKSQNLVPQLEEDIIKAQWMTLSKFQKLDEAVYQSIRDVLETIG